MSLAESGPSTIVAIGAIGEHGDKADSDRSNWRLPGASSC